jgi:hypothetical protein
MHIMVFSEQYAADSRSDKEEKMFAGAEEFPT